MLKAKSICCVKLAFQGMHFSTPSLKRKKREFLLFWDFSLFKNGAKSIDWKHFKLDIFEKAELPHPISTCIFLIAVHFQRAYTWLTPKISSSKMHPMQCGKRMLKWVVTALSLLPHPISARV